MKILSVNKFYHIKGGSETYYFALSRLLEERGISVVPFSMKDERNLPSDYEKYFINNIDYLQKNIIKKIFLSLKLIYSHEAVSGIRRIVHDANPDIAHLHVFQHQFSVSILHELKRMGIPVVYTAHDLKPLCPTYKMLCGEKICERCKKHKYYNCFMHKCTKGSYCYSLVNTIEMYFQRLMQSYQNVDCLICPSKFYLDKFKEYEIPAKKMVHIPNFLPDDDALSMQSKNYTGETENKFAYIGRLSEEKGLLTLIEAMKYVHGPVLYIAGSGPLRHELERRIAEYGLDNVKLTGFLTGADIAKLLNICRFTVLPSEWYENCPMSVLESMSLGKPVIATNIGGLPELIEYGRTGLLSGPGDFRSIAECIIKMAGNLKKTYEMGCEAMDVIEKKYRSNMHYEKILRIYSELSGK